MGISPLPGPGGPLAPLSADAIRRVIVASLPLPEPGDAVVLRNPAPPAAAAELMRLWEIPASVRSEAALEYAAARQAPTPDKVLLHLDRAIRLNPEYAAATVREPDFAALRDPVAALLARATAAAHLDADHALSRAAEAIGEARPHREATAILQAAESKYQLHSYAGYIEAAVAARLAERLAAERCVRVEPAASKWPAALASTARAGWSRVRVEAAGLWRRLPLFAILLAWLAAGILFGVAQRMLGLGTAVAWILPFWGVGLLAIVAVGFLRSLRRPPVIRRAFPPPPPRD